MHSLLHTRNFVSKPAFASCLFASRGFASQGVLFRGKFPTIEVKHVTEEPKNGYFVQVTNISRGMEFVFAPQMGPPKTDPKDEVPQFNMKEKIYYRPNRGQFYDLLGVTSGKSAKADITTSYGATVALKKTPDGFNFVIDSPTKHEAEGKHRYAEVNFTNQHAAALKNFFEFSLHSGFGFQRKSQQEATVSPRQAVSKPHAPGKHSQKNRRRREARRQRIAQKNSEEKSGGEDKAEPPKKADVEKTSTDKKEVKSSKGKGKKSGKGKKKTTEKKEKQEEKSKVDEFFDDLVG